MKYLDDPKGSFGGEENITTIARKGLKKDMPKVYRIVDRFNWSVKDMESVMLDMNDGMSAEEAAQKWIDTHQDQVKQWLQ